MRTGWCWRWRATRTSGLGSWRFPHLRGGRYGLLSTIPRPLPTNPVGRASNVSTKSKKDAYPSDAYARPSAPREAPLGMVQPRRVVPATAMSPGRQTRRGLALAMHPNGQVARHVPCVSERRRQYGLSLVRADRLSSTVKNGFHHENPDGPDLRAQVEPQRAPRSWFASKSATVSIAIVASRGKRHGSADALRCSPLGIGLPRTLHRVLARARQPRLGRDLGCLRLSTPSRRLAAKGLVPDGRNRGG